MICARAAASRVGAGAAGEPAQETRQYGNGVCLLGAGGMFKCGDRTE